MLGQDEKWTYENKKKIEIMSSFNYLGVIKQGSFVEATSMLSGNALKAIHSLFPIIMKD